MTINNIRDSKAFFSVLSRCKGEVDLIDKNGNCVRLPLRDENSAVSPFACYDGAISAIELKFHRVEDMHEILHYVMAGPRPQRRAMTA